MNIVKIYEEGNVLPTYIIESKTQIDSTIYLFDICKEEIYIDEELIDTIYHTI